MWWKPGEKNKDHIASSQAWWWECHGCGMSAVRCRELQFIKRSTNANMCCDILKQSMKLDRWAVFQHDNDPKQDDLCLDKETEGKGAGLHAQESRGRAGVQTNGHFGNNLDIFTWGVKITFVARSLDINGCVLI
ncbi:hypothetical protein GOODEAATRI_002925 [Goodea atripinnis]|uniref:Uncharacterized protein n=1 Tax=Goodea atripinnis TaxID=208336 RepID=A0ABV0NRE1_9TELE